MIEDEIFSLLTQAKELYKTHEATAEALGVSRSTFYSWIKDGKGIKEQPLFKAMDILGAHITVDREKTQKRDNELSLSCQNSMKTMEMLKIDVLKTKNEGLESKITALTSHNESLKAHNLALQEQLRVMNYLIQQLMAKKENSDSSIPLTQIG